MYSRGEIKQSTGYQHTLDEMRRLVDTGRRSPSVVARARDLTRQVPDRNTAQEVRAIHAFVRDNVRYTNDPWGVETLTDPTDMLREVDLAGRASEDCDAHVVLEASLLEAIGTPTRFNVASMDATRPGDPSHVWLEARVGGEWVPLDPIVKDKPAGWIAPELAGLYPTTGMGDFTDDISEKWESFKNATDWIVGLGLFYLTWRFIIGPIVRR